MISESCGSSVRSSLRVVRGVYRIHSHCSSVIGKCCWPMTLTEIWNVVAESMVDPHTPGLLMRWQRCRSGSSWIATHRLANTSGLFSIVCTTADLIDSWNLSVPSYPLEIERNKQFPSPSDTSTFRLIFWSISSRELLLLSEVEAFVGCACDGTNDLQLEWCPSMWVVETRGVRVLEMSLKGLQDNKPQLFLP